MQPSTYTTPLDEKTFKSTVKGGFGGASDTAVQNLYDAFKPKVSTTTISNDNKMNQVPGIENKFNTLADTGVRTDPATGAATYANGSAYEEAKTKEADTSEEDAAIQANLDTMKASTDSQTADIISNIQKRFAQRKAEQADINARQKKAYTNALLMGGVTGQGSSAQYAPISSEGIIGAQESYGVKQLADLDAEEQDLIAQARAAQSAQNYKLLETKNAQIEQKRQQKIAAATKLNEKIIEQNAKARETAIQATRDMALTDLYSQGITDPSQMLSYLNGNGGDFTLKEVTEGIKALVPPGLDDLVKTLRTNGAPKEVIQGVLSSRDINSAYEAAGSWGAGGSGIVGEYNLYKAQAEQAGQVPMDFNSYQNVDANRKIKIAAAGVANEYGLDKEQRARVYSLMDDYDKQTKDIKTVISSSSQIDALSKLALSSNKDKGSRAASQIGTIFSFMKMLDPSSTVREGEYATAQNTAGVTDKVRNSYNKALNGSFLTDGQINGYVSTAKALATARERNLEEINSEFDRRALISGIPAGVISTATSKTTNQALIETEAQAKSAIDQMYALADEKVQDSIDTLVGKGYNNLKVVEYLKSKGLIAQ